MIRCVGLAALLYTFVSMPGVAQMRTPTSAPVRSLGDAPKSATPPTSAPSASRALAIPADSTPGLSLDPSTRHAARNFYNAIYGASDGFAVNWTGSVSNNVAGTTDADFQAAVALRVNFFRAFAGVPGGITLNSTWNGEAQQGALMMSANDALNHHPPSSWTDYSSAGATAASSSNLALGNYGPDAVTAYVGDPGSNNAEVGHRRWVLYPETLQMGTGDIPPNGSNPSANDLWVFDFGHPVPTPRDGFVAWPPKGYVPYQFIFPRWSFSLNGGDFSAAKVVVTSSGASISTTIVSSTDNGYGDNTLVWTLAGEADGTTYAAPSADTTYTVTVSNVMLSNVAHSYTYSVIVFDPSVPGSDDILPTLNAPSSVAVSTTTPIAFTTLAEASGYDVWSATLQTASWVEGAETTPYHLTAQTTGTYLPVNTTTSATGSKCFQLCQDGFNNQDLLLNSSFVASSNSAISFQTRYGYLTATQLAQVQVSLDNGNSWSTVFSRAGTDSDTGSFAPQSVSLAAYAHRIIRVRFLLNYTGGEAYTQTGANDVGWLIDTITPVNLAEASGITETPIAGSPDTFTAPNAAGTVNLAVRAVLFGQYPLEYGPVSSFNVAASSTTPYITSGTTAGGTFGTSLSYAITVTSTGSSTTFAATGLPPGLTVDSGTGVISGTPTQPGAYSVHLSATNNSTGEVATATVTFTIGKATAVVSVPAISLGYTGSAQAVTATTTPTGLTLTYTYDGSAMAPSAMGTYQVVATVSDANYQGTGQGTLTISPAMATINLLGLTGTYTGHAHPVSAVTTPAGLPVKLTYDGGAAVPVNAGSYTVAATVATASYAGSASGTLTITPLVETITLGHLTMPFTGHPIAVTASAKPISAPVTITYFGSATPPASIGAYPVHASVSNANYAGTADATLTISPVVTTGLASAVSGRTALISGRASPGAAVTSASFEYGTDTMYGQSVPAVAGAMTGTALNESAQLVGLLPGTTYHYRLDVVSTAGTTPGLDKTFATLAVPVVNPSPDVYLSATGVQVGQLVNPAGFATTVTFNYGTTSALGETTTARLIGSGKANVTVLFSLAGLLPNTRYYYQSVATSAAGSVPGPILWFTTPAFDVNQIAMQGASYDGITASTLGDPAVNVGEHVAYDVNAGTPSAAVLFDDGSTTTAVAEAGQTAPGAGGATFLALSDPVLNANDAVAFRATLKLAAGESGGTAGIWSTGSGSLQLVARVGGPAPLEGGGTGTFATLNALGLSDVGPLIYGTLSLSSAPVVSATNNAGIWFANSGGTLAQVLRLGDAITTPAGSKTIVKLAFLPASVPFVNGQTRGFAAATGEVVCGVTFSDKTTGVCTAEAGDAPRLVAMSGSTYAAFGVPAINNQGHVAFAATLAAGPGVTATTNRGIFAEDSSGTWQPVVRSGAAAPGRAAIFATFSDPVYNNHEAVAFRATLQGSAATGLWATSANGQALAKIASQGDGAAGCPAGTSFASFSQLALADQGGADNESGVLFSAMLSGVAGSGVSSANNFGIWAVDSDGNLQLIVRTGDVLQGRTVAALSFLPSLPTVGGQTRSFSAERGDVVFRATFTDKSTALYNVVFP